MQKGKKRRLNWDFSQQVQICAMLIFGALILGNLFDFGILINLSWIISGLLFLFHPVWPENLYPVHPKRGRMSMRTVGLLFLFIGIFVTFRVRA